jgi:hypothetical protein
MAAGGNPLTLTIQDLGALGELLGSVAVLVTLIYLALQTRQNTMAIEAQLDAARMGAVRELNLVAATSTELQEALNHDRAEPLTSEQARRNSFWMAAFAQLQWTFRQARLGFMPTPEAIIAHRVLAYFNDFRSVGGWWDAQRSAFHPEFVEWVEEQRSKAA